MIFFLLKNYIKQKELEQQEEIGSCSQKILKQMESQSVFVWSKFPVPLKPPATMAASYFPSPLRRRSSTTMASAVSPALFSKPETTKSLVSVPPPIHGKKNLGFRPTPELGLLSLLFPLSMVPTLITLFFTSAKIEISIIFWLWNQNSFLHDQISDLGFVFRPHWQQALGALFSVAVVSIPTLIVSSTGFPFVCVNLSLQVSHIIRMTRQRLLVSFHDLHRLLEDQELQ